LNGVEPAAPATPLVESARRPAGLRMNPASLLAQLRHVALFKAAQLLGMALFTIAAPRLMGPELYGRFAVILSFTMLWMASSNLGARFVFGRFIPEYATLGETARVRGLFMQMLVLRLVVVAAVAPFFYLFLRRVLPEASTTTLLAAMGSLFAMTTGAAMFAVFYGLNQLGASMGREAFSRYALLGLLFLFGAGSSLERASLALLVTQTAGLAVGAWLCRDLFTLDRSESRMPAVLGHLRFGVVVFGANLLLRLPWRLGESALALGGVEPAEIAFFSIALSAPVAFTRLIGETTTLQIPTLSLRQAAGDASGRDRSLGLALKYLTGAGVLFVLTAYALGPWAVRTFWGEQFLGVVPNLLLVAPTALGVPYVRTALSLAVVETRLARNLQLGLVAVGAFVAAAAALVPSFGSRGASAALVAAIGAAAVAASFQMRATGVLAAARAGRHLAAAAAAGALLAAAGGSPLAAVAAAVVYGALLFALGVVRRAELAALAAGIWRPGSAASPS